MWTSNDRLFHIPCCSTYQPFTACLHDVYTQANCIQLRLPCCAGAAPFASYLWDCVWLILGLRQQLGQCNVLQASSSGKLRKARALN